MRASRFAGIADRVGGRSIYAKTAGALAVMLASFATTDRAQADCTPNSPVSNATVTCTGTTSGSNHGFGSQNDTGNTVTVQVGATVSGKTNGIQAADSLTVANSGTISETGVAIGTPVGLVSGGSLTLSNFSSGMITAPDTNGQAIAAITLNITSNAGTISGNFAGIFVTNATIANSGTISTSNGVALIATKELMLSNSSTGIIETTDAQAGTAISGGSAVNIIDNSGKIFGGALAIDARSDVTVTNSGSISSDSTSISVEGNARVMNSGAITGGDRSETVSSRRAPPIS
jgi:hypothetical protein